MVGLKSTNNWGQSRESIPLCFGIDVKLHAPLHGLLKIYEYFMNFGSLFKFLSISVYSITYFRFIYFIGPWTMVDFYIGTWTKKFEIGFMN